jgi:two-component system cell cycle response regulator
MTGLILVVDDVPANVKLLEAKLTNEYYDVVTARDGFEALEVANAKHPDIILLDVMMPRMDGFETCKKLKSDPATAHIPVVMVTALSDKEDRVRGLEAGADDFLTKPINDTALFARVKSLVRMKALMDELRLRDQTGLQMGVLDEGQGDELANVAGARVLVVDDDAVQVRRICQVLTDAGLVPEGITEPESSRNVAVGGGFDLIIVSTMMTESDGLRLASYFKSQEEIRHTPILMLVDEDDERSLLKGLEMGVNDYLISPVDGNEMLARVRTQIRRKRYQEALKANYKQSISMAITDGLTGLYNRHYLNTHLANMVREALGKNKALSLLMMDLDNFKSVNDTYGHDAGDKVLQQLSKIIVTATRGADLVARFGGEEFVVLMPETEFKPAVDAAERIRRMVQDTPLIVNDTTTVSRTVSIGVAGINQLGDSAEALLKRADNAAYEAKHSGKNRVCTAENM